MRHTTLTWMALALAGLAIAAALTFAASRIIGQPLGVVSAPQTRDRLAVEEPARRAPAATRTSTTRTATAPSTRTVTVPVPTTTVRTVVVPAPVVRPAPTASPKPTPGGSAGDDGGGAGDD